MNILLKKNIWKTCLFIINTFLSTTRFYCIKRFLLNISEIFVGENTKVVGPIYIGTVAKLTIGDNCWVGSELKIHGNGSVHIGNNCDFAPEISFITGSHELGTNERRAGVGISYETIVENGCWIGTRATILGDIKIESGSIIGAVSLVNKSVKSNTIVAGIPAKLIKALND